MANVTWETVRIRGEGIAPDLLIWRRYKMPSPLMLELMLDRNPQIMEDLAVGPYLAVGRIIHVPIDRDILEDRPVQAPSINLFGRR